MVAGEGVRSSTPGKGARQWTSAGTSIHESAMFNTGIAVPRHELGAPGSNGSGSPFGSSTSNMLRMLDTAW